MTADIQTQHKRGESEERAVGHLCSVPCYSAAASESASTSQLPWEEEIKDFFQRFIAQGTSQLLSHAEALLAADEARGGYFSGGKGDSPAGCSLCRRPAWMSLVDNELPRERKWRSSPWSQEEEPCSCC